MDQSSPDRSLNASGFCFAVDRNCKTAALKKMKQMKNRLCHKRKTQSIVIHHKLDMP